MVHRGHRPAGCQTCCSIMPSAHAPRRSGDAAAMHGHGCILNRLHAPAQACACAPFVCHVSRFRCYPVCPVRVEMLSDLLLVSLRARAQKKKQNKKQKGKKVWASPSLLLYTHKARELCCKTRVQHVQLRSVQRVQNCATSNELWRGRPCLHRTASALWCCTCQANTKRFCLSSGQMTCIFSRTMCCRCCTCVSVIHNYGTGANLCCVLSRDCIYDP